MTERNYVQMPDASGPQGGRYYLFPDVELLRRLPGTPAESAAVDEQGLAVGRNHQDGIALAHVNRFDQHGVARMLCSTRQDGGQRRENQRRPCPAAPPSASARQQNGQRKQSAKRRALPHQ